MRRQYVAYLLPVLTRGVKFNHGIDASRFCINAMTDVINFWMTSSTVALPCVEMAAVREETRHMVQVSPDSSPRLTVTQVAGD